MSTPKSILFVWPGGGLPGLDILAGMWLALEEAGIESTVNSGTSAGAIIGAMNSAGKSARQTADYLRELQDDDVRHARPFWPFRLGKIDSIMYNDRVLERLEEMLPSQHYKLQKPLFAWAVRRRGRAVANVCSPAIAQDPAVAVLASSAIPGFFPPVLLRDGELYSDGCTRFNLPLPADWQSYDEVWLLIGRKRAQDYRGGGGILAELIEGLEEYAEDQILDRLAEVAGAPNVRVLQPHIETAAGALHFDHRLIEEARVRTAELLGKMPKSETLECP
jgi:predicted acylesterase/phospholipase RssA